MSIRSTSLCLGLVVAVVALIPARTLAQKKKEFEPGKRSTIQTKDVHYSIRVPKKLDRKRGSPTIVFIHGSNMRGENYVGSLETAPSLRKWVLIGPTGPRKANKNAFNHNPGDERYVAKVIADVEKRLKIKLGKLYVGGHSQGAFLSHAVAAHLPDRVDGVLAVSGGTWVAPKKLLRKGKGRKGAIPIAIVHGQDDPVVNLLASVGVYDAYLKAKHEEVRLFAPTQGAHMFMRLPILPALQWLDLMNTADKKVVSKALSKTKMEDDPRTLWDAARRLKVLSKGKSKKADGLLKKLKAEGGKLAKDLGSRLKKASKADKTMQQEGWTFLANWGMVAAAGSWRKAFKKVRK